MQTLKELVEQLPPELHKEVIDFVKSLIERQTIKRKDKPRFHWRGALRELRDKYTSVELQHRILQWWGD
jgi:hypothetical protein